MKDESEEPDLTKEALPGLPVQNQVYRIEEPGLGFRKDREEVSSSFTYSQIIIKNLLNDMYCCKHGAIAVNKIIKLCFRKHVFYKVLPRNLS